MEFSLITAQLLAGYHVIFITSAKGGYVFGSVGLFVRKVTEKVMNGF